MAIISIISSSSSANNANNKQRCGNDFARIMLIVVIVITVTMTMTSYMVLATGTTYYWSPLDDAMKQYNLRTRDCYTTPTPNNHHQDQISSIIPKLCVSPFMNIAYNRTFQVTNTCGDLNKGRQEFYTTDTTTLDVCDASDDKYAHLSRHITDQNEKTWWQSETMADGIKHVNLTIELKKRFVISYIFLKFKSPRPESMSIYKQDKVNGPWIPYRYYSLMCPQNYKTRDLKRLPIAAPNADLKAPLCSSDEAYISPLTGGEILFSPLKERPMRNPDEIPELREFIGAAGIRISLDGMNTFGDETVNGNIYMRQKYYYAIIDISIGGYCDCNGHAKICDPILPESEEFKCLCEHNTTGDDCERCAPFHHDAPWKSATESSANECKICNCNGKSDKCLYDAELYRTTGHGGRCQDCRDNTDGAHCESCKQGYYLNNETNRCELCSCDPIGTESAFGGFSLFGIGGSSMNASLPECDSSGHCKCKSRVGGRTCDRCSEGYYNINEGCKKCDCDPIGCTDRVCDSNDGRCLCKPGVTGDKCNKCMELHYGFSRTGCTQCNCDTDGSNSTQCDENGQCQCKVNLEGLRCERCKENMHNKRVGCEDCGPCYQIVQLGVDHHRKLLKNLTDMIRNIEMSPQTIQDPAFNRQLLDLINEVDALASKADIAFANEINLLSQLDNLAQRVKKIRESSEIVSKHLDSARRPLDEARDDVTTAENLLKRIQDELLKARNHIRIDGQAAIMKANERSQRLDEHYKHISEMAKQSRIMAEDHRAQAENILSLANQALRNSTEAYNLAKDTVLTHEAHAKNIQLLTAALKEAIELMERTQKMSIESNAQAKHAYEEALALFTAIKNLDLSPYDVDKLRNEANDNLKNARRLQIEVEEFLKRHRLLLDTTFITMQEMKDLLEETRRQQQITDKQLADIDKTLQESKAALSSGEQILKDGMETLKALREFDILVEKSRSESKSALEMIPQIRKIIGDAENKTREAEGKLATALEDATDARDIARNAFEIANKTTSDARQIRIYASELKDKSAQLRQQTNELTDNVKATDSAMTSYEKIAKVDGEMAQRTLRDANQAAMSAQNATDTARYLLNLLGPLLKSIDEMQGIDPVELERLENLLETLRKQYSDSHVKSWLDSVQDDLLKQKLKFKMYEAEIEWLKNEVANIREIRDSLPDKCFKRERLEVESANSKFEDWNPE